jgi:hypothetical protein
MTRPKSAAAVLCLAIACAHDPAGEARRDTTTLEVVATNVPNEPTPNSHAARDQVVAGALPETATRALGWLVEHQLPSGGWGQGDEVVREGEAPSETGNVADTCIAALALVRAGSTPSEGTYRESVRRAAEFVIASIERADEQSLWVTDVHGTRVQSKIGQYVDTFTSLNFLNELRGTMGTQAAEGRLDRALAKVRRKIERNQSADGTWAQQGWAPTLGQALAARGLNLEAQAGAPVDRRVLERVEQQARRRFDPAQRRFAPGEGSAGVDLYDVAGTASTLHQSAATQKGDKQSAPDIHTQAAEASRALAARLEDPSFVAGFGSNGGEEFLSYMLIAETLSARGGEDYERFHGAMTTLLAGVQNSDGSWSGHHCITGRTFCTATALLVILSDRLPRAQT